MRVPDNVWTLIINICNKVIIIITIITISSEAIAFLLLRFFPPARAPVNLVSGKKE